MKRSMTIFFSATLLALSSTVAWAKAIGDANLGDKVDRTSLVGLNCKTSGITSPMTCTVHQENSMKALAVLQPSDDTSVLFMTAVMLETYFEGGTFDQETATRTVREMKQGLIDELMTSQGYTIRSVDGDNIVHLSGKYNVQCWGRTSTGTAPSLLVGGKKGYFKVGCSIKEGQTLL